MKSEDHKSVLDFLSSKGNVPCHDVLKQVQEKFASLNSNSLISIVLQWYTIVVTQKSKGVPRNKLYRQYKDIVSRMGSKHWGKCIEEMSAEYEIAPSLVAKFILTGYIQEKNGKTNINNKAEINRLYRNPYLIEDDRLSAEIRRCLLIDAAYGPVVSVIRELIGFEHEEILKHKLEELEIGYQNEDTLKSLGFDKTPDIRLVEPILVDGELIAWIESKALFAGPDTHSKYWHNQYKCYLDRYGPGMVIYWHGFVDDLADEALKKGVILRNCFPEVKKYDNEPKF